MSMLGMRSIMKEMFFAEDNEDLHEILTTTFRDADYRVHGVNDGRKALAYLQEHTPNLLIFDINMPYVSGFELIDYVRSESRFDNSRILVITGNTIAADAPELVVVDLVLVKPVNFFELRILADRLLSMDV